MPAELSNTFQASAKTDEFQEYVSHGQMATIEKSLCSKSNFQMDVSFVKEVGARYSKVSCEYSPNETEYLEHHVSAIPESIDPMRGVVKLDATYLDGVYQNIDNQATATNQNAAWIACAHIENRTGIEGVEPASQALANTDPCSRENETFSLGENTISKHSAHLADGREPVFDSETGNLVDTMAITDDSKLCSADVVNKMEASQDYETEIQEATINQELAGGWKKSAMGRDS